LGQDAGRCRLLFLLGYAGARAFVAGALIRAVRRIRARMPAR
jgi:hypothetical protein